MPRTFRPGLAQQQNLYKPPPGAQINWDHPWADDLQFAMLLHEKGGLTVYDLKKRRRGTLQTGVTFARGGLDITGTGFVDVPESDDAPFLNSITILGRWAIDTASAFRHFVGKHAGAGGTNNPFDFRTNNDANLNIRLVRANAVASREWSGPNYGSVGVLRTIGVSAPTDISVAPTFYLNGIPTAGSLIGGSGSGAATGSGANIRIGRRADGVVQMDGATQWLYIWGLQLPPAVIQALTVNPWAVILPATPRSRWFFLELTGLFRDAQLPLEFGGLDTRQRDPRLPVELQGIDTRQRDPQLPVELSRKESRDAQLPLDFGGLEARNRDTQSPLEFLGTAHTRNAQLPLDFAGIDPNLLLHRWLVLVKKSLPLLHSWDVFKLAETFALQHEWTVKELLPPLPHRWNVTPDVLTPFGADITTGEPLPGGAGDIQVPVATKDKTP